MTPTEEARFIALWNAGTEAAAIAQQLGIPRGTVFSRTHPRPPGQDSAPAQGWALPTPASPGAFRGRGWTVHRPPCTVDRPP